MNQALYINGVFTEVLEEIVKAQNIEKDLACTLQPYSKNVIKLLEGHNFSKIPTITFYISTTIDLQHVSYVAEIVGWEDKRNLENKPAKLDQLNEQIGKYQPIQGEVYFHSDENKEKECVNLIEIKNLRKIAIPFQVGHLIKISDETPYKPRTQSGGWSPVQEVSVELMEAETSWLEEAVQKDLDEKVAASLKDDSDVRRERLNNADTTPTVIQIVSKGFKRNPDVIAEVLFRAKGICERCKTAAPFIRKKDQSPYLEVHHKIMLANQGDDSVENAEALCPNCHREVHFGV